MEATNRGTFKDITGFSAYEKPGQGDYSRNNLLSHTTADIAATYVIKALDNLNYDPNCGRPFTICEYGAADGLTSVPVMNQTIEHVRGKYGKDTPITIIYEDRPTADFNSVFRALSGELKEPFANYPSFDENVFVFATGTGFYQQCLPNESLDFAYSSFSLHYLSERPCQLQNAINVAESRDPQERSLFAAQAAKDWSTTLLQRAKELVPGGQMLLCVPVTDEMGQYAGKNQRVPGYSLFDFVAKPWKEMIQEGRITQEEFADMSFNSYWRAVEEFTAPFRDETSAVYRAGLRLVSLKTQVTTCPLQTEWLKQENKDGTSRRQEFAQKAVNEIRRWHNWLYLQALEKKRPHEESVSIVEEFWKRFEHLAAANLDNLHVDNPVAYICIEKVVAQE